jgi:NADPH:quinone reductase-like Zn-dependent oxidoreductase
MAADEVPTIMQAWQFATTKGGIENNLRLNNSATIPQPKKDEHLVQVLAMSLNPMDHKPAEVRLVDRLAIPKPATPGHDFAGRIVRPAGGSPFKEGQMIFGAAGDPFAGGALAEYAAVPSKGVSAVPESVSAIQAAGVPMAGLTAYQSTVPFIKPGSRIFINGSSGGVGSFSVQFAKQAGAHVTASCSAASAELARSLGADEVVDYKKSSVLCQLQALAKEFGPFDLVVDNVGGNHELYWKMHTYTNPSAIYLYIGFGPSLSFFSFFIKASLLPGFLGGGKRKLQLLVPKLDQEHLDQAVNLVADGSVKVVIDGEYTMEQAVEAYRRLKSGRSKGKIVVQIGA